MISRDDYILRIQQASPARLVVITYELIDEFLQSALDTEDDDVFAHNAEKAKNAVALLMSGLNFDIEMSEDLYDVYLYVFRSLTRAYLRYDRAAVKESLTLMRMLQEGFQSAAEQEASVFPPNENTQIFAGLTYQRDGLSEYIMQNDNRGYRA